MFRYLYDQYDEGCVRCLVVPISISLTIGDKTQFTFTSVQHGRAPTFGGLVVVNVKRCHIIKHSKS
jgi:hypothetical protein